MWQREMMIYWNNSVATSMFYICNDFIKTFCYKEEEDGVKMAPLS